MVLQQETYERLHSAYGKGAVYFLAGEEAKYAILNQAGVQVCIGSVSMLGNLPSNNSAKQGSSLDVFDLD